MIWFVGAGPGDPELITVKGRRLLEEADVVVYAGSLVPKEVLRWAQPGAEVHDSSVMYLEQMVDLMASAHQAGCKVVRLHSGDPSLYGAIGEQMKMLEAKGVPYEVVPGVSSFLAAAAVLGTELTLPGISQTVIVTRLGGRTPVPPAESLRELARHQATMALLLSVHQIKEAAEELLLWYPPDTPVAVVHKATRPDQQIVNGVLGDIAQKVLQAGIVDTATILVGKVLGASGEHSCLYDEHFSHRFRSGATRSCGESDPTPESKELP